MQGDLVVVGAGAAGAVIAARVSERGDLAVTLVEAGPDRGPGTAPTPLPHDLDDGTRNSLTAHDWGFTHDPTAGQVRMPFPRGRVVGGSSAVNTCIALRGVPSDYDEWASLGLDEWSWAHCLPAFKRLETDLDFDDAWHGREGPMPLRRHPPDELTPWSSAFIDACGRAGYPRCDDHNRPGALGFGPHAMNKIDGRRMSAARCYLTEAVRARPNLRIVADALVRRVVFEGRRAVGIEIERAGAIEVIKARKVVLAAGALGTPGVLLRSGVGPRDEVTRLGVTPVAHVPAVGARLLDHPGTALFMTPRRGVVDLAGALVQVALRLRSPTSDHDGDVQLQAISGVHLPRFSLPLVAISCQVGKPRGAGTLRFASADPRAAPIITSKLLDHPDDRAHAVRSMLIARDLARVAPLSDLATPVWPPSMVLDRPALLDRAIALVCGSGYHPCGTVPMGRDGDPHAATDGRGHVRGVDGLVVADASLMPTVPTSNIHLPTLMIGERFGAWLRDDQA